MGVVIPFDGQVETDGRPRPSLDPLVRLTGQDMTLINDLIKEKAQSHVELIPQLAGHLINSGGKRIRPMLTVAAARMCGYSGLHHVKLAMSVEFMHTATLLHDDVVDESDMRRGKEAARIIWGNQASVLVGDYLLGQAFKIMVETGSLECLRILSEASCIIAEGEVLQLAVSQDTSTTEDSYLKVVVSKTAALFSAAARVGAVISNRPRKEQEALEAYGRNLGIAFQLVDDALDYAGSRAAMGKSVGDDFRERKITLPVILAFRRGSEPERKFWRRALEEGDQTNDDLLYAQKLLERHGSITETMNSARHYGQLSKDALAIFVDNDWKAALLEAVDFCTSRTH
jgi:octaprenyl-diphosphate synthase